MQELIVDWTGFQGGPGVSVMYFDEAVSIPRASLRTFFDAIKALIPDDATVNIRAEGDLIQASDGALIGSWSGAPVAAVVGTATANYAAPVGVQLKWSTAGIVHNRRVRGRTFLVPMASTAFDSAGAVSSTAISTILTAAQAYLTAAGTSPLIWSRPFAGAPGNPARIGTSHVVTAVSIPNKPVVLTSRRD